MRRHIAADDDVVVEAVVLGPPGLGVIARVLSSVLGPVDPLVTVDEDVTSDDGAITRILDTALIGRTKDIALDEVVLALSRRICLSSHREDLHELVASLIGELVVSHDGTVDSHEHEVGVRGVDEGVVFDEVTVAATNMEAVRALDDEAAPDGDVAHGVSKAHRLPARRVAEGAVLDRDVVLSPLGAHPAAHAIGFDPVDDDIGAPGQLDDRVG